MTAVGSLIVADWNLSREAVGKIADRLGGHLVVGHGVDHGIALGEAHLHSVQRRLAKGPSDHHPLLITVEVDGERFTVLWWNVYVGSRPSKVAEHLDVLLHRFAPDLVFLGEAKRCRQALRALAKDSDYRHRQGRRGEAVNMAVLERRGVRVRRRGWLRLTTRWVGPVHGLAHEPRAYARRVIARRRGGPRLRVLAAHQPTGGYGGRNRKAVRESVRRILRWGTRRSKEKTVTHLDPPSPPVIDGTPAHHSGEDNHPIQRVVIHSAVMPCEPGRAEQLGLMNSRGTGGGSWHYATDPTSTYQCSYDRFVCWHAPPNAHSIGIEMADNPGPVPGDKPGSARWKALKRSWRWARKPQRQTLRRTARLTAHLALAYDLPLKWLSPADLREGRRGITSHANVSASWGQSTHWDPGFWPRWRFMHMVRRHAKRLRDEAAST